MGHSFDIGEIWYVTSTQQELILFFNADNSNVKEQENIL